MCFSASVSFTVAAGTGLVGALTVRKVSHWRELPLASIPLIFAAQQTLEGLLWLSLANGGDAAWIAPLANMFMYCALVVWPIWIPLSVGLGEPDRMRRLALALPFALAMRVSFLNLSDIWAHPYGVGVVQHSLAYTNGTQYSAVEYAAYVACACCPALLSSDKILRLFGAIVATGLIVSLFVHVVAFISVWCFFAAAGSVMLYLYFVTAAEAMAMRRLA